MENSVGRTAVECICADEFVYLLSLILNNSYREHITKISVMQATRTTRTAFGHGRTPKTPMVRSYSQTQHTCQRNTTKAAENEEETKNVHGQLSRVAGSGATAIMRCCSQPPQMEKDHSGSVQVGTPTIGPVKG